MTFDELLALSSRIAGDFQAEGLELPIFSAEDDGAGRYPWLFVCYPGCKKVLMMVDSIEGYENVLKEATRIREQQRVAALN